MSKVSTGLCDSEGTEMFVGDMVKVPVTCNEDFHGSYSIYEIKQQGLTPVFSYVRSEKGEMLPKGYAGAVLAEWYDTKMFLMAEDSLALRPTDDFVVVKEDE
jgi:hypothetical protein